MSVLKTLFYPLFFICLLYCQLQQEVFAQYVYHGNARRLDEKRHRLTRKLHDARGAVWSSSMLDLRKPFDIKFEVFLGCRYADSDGLAFVLQQEGLDALGGGSAGMGYGGIFPSLSVEFDNYNDDYEYAGKLQYTHVAIMRDGDFNHKSPNNLAGPVTANARKDQQIRGCRQYEAFISWNPEKNVMIVEIDGKKRLTCKENIIQTCFGQNPLVYWGFTAANSSERFNTQGVKLLEVNIGDLPPEDPITVENASPIEPIITPEEDTPPLPPEQEPNDLNNIQLTYTKRDIPAKLGGRTVLTGKSVIINSDEISISVFDNEREDGDTVSLYLNGQWILREHLLTKNKTTVTVKIDRNADNYLILYAHNQGLVPPNTCSLTISDGKKEKYILLSSDLKNSDSVKFKFGE